MSKQFWSSEKLLSLTAVFISLCTLAVFIYQTDLMRKHQYLSVFPYLELNHEGIGTKAYKFVLTNNGIGPALIRQVTVRKHDTLYREDIADYLGRTHGKPDSLDFYYANLYQGRLIAPKETVVLIGNSDQKEGTAQKISDILADSSLFVNIEYESVYGERWKITHHATTPIKIK